PALRAAPAARRNQRLRRCCVQAAARRCDRARRKGHDSRACATTLTSASSTGPTTRPRAAPRGRLNQGDFYMPLIVLRHDQSLVHVNAESQRPIVPVLAGETVTILRDGAVLDTVGVAGCGPFRVDEPFYGGCRLFGLEPEVLDAARTRLDPRVGNGVAPAWQ